MNRDIRTTKNNIFNNREQLEEHQELHHKISSSSSSSSSTSLIDPPHISNTLKTTTSLIHNKKVKKQTTKISSCSQLNCCCIPNSLLTTSNSNETWMNNSNQSLLFEPTEENEKQQQTPSCYNNKKDLKHHYLIEDNKYYDDKNKINNKEKAILSSSIHKTYCNLDTHNVFQQSSLTQSQHSEHEPSISTSIIRNMSEATAIFRDFRSPLDDDDRDFPISTQQQEQSQLLFPFNLKCQKDYTPDKHFLHYSNNNKKNNDDPPPLSLWAHQNKNDDNDSPPLFSTTIYGNTELQSSFATNGVDNNNNNHHHYNAENCHLTQSGRIWNNNDTSKQIRTTSLSRQPSISCLAPPLTARTVISEPSTSSCCLLQDSMYRCRHKVSKDNNINYHCNSNNRSEINTNDNIINITDYENSIQTQHGGNNYNNFSLSPLTLEAWSAPDCHGVVSSTLLLEAMTRSSSKNNNDDPSVQYKNSQSITELGSGLTTTSDISALEAIKSKHSYETTYLSGGHGGSRRQAYSTYSSNIATNTSCNNTTTTSLSEFPLLSTQQHDMHHITSSFWDEITETSSIETTSPSLSVTAGVAAATTTVHKKCETNYDRSCNDTHSRLTGGATTQQSSLLLHSIPIKKDDDFFLSLTTDTATTASNKNDKTPDYTRCPSSLLDISQNDDSYNHNEISPERLLWIQHHQQEQRSIMMSSSASSSICLHDDVDSLEKPSLLTLLTDSSCKTFGNHDHNTKQTNYDTNNNNISSNNMHPKNQHIITSPRSHKETLYRSLQNTQNSSYEDAYYQNMVQEKKNDQLTLPKQHQQQQQQQNEFYQSSSFKKDSTLLSSAFSTLTNDIDAVYKTLGINQNNHPTTILSNSHLFGVKNFMGERKKPIVEKESPRILCPSSKSTTRSSSISIKSDTQINRHKFDSYKPSHHVTEDNHEDFYDQLNNTFLDDTIPLKNFITNGQMELASSNNNLLWQPRINKTTTTCEERSDLSSINMNNGEGDYDNDNNDIDAKDIVGRVINLAKLQTGSRHLQRLLSRNQPQVTSLILKEATENLMELMMDPYGNYLCQHLFQCCNTSQRQKLIQTLALDACTVARDRRGTHSMQALSSYLKTEEEEFAFIRPLNAQVFALSLHPHGTHVIQRALECFHKQALNIILRTVVENLEELAINPHGLCVVKKAITAVIRLDSEYKLTLLEQLSGSVTMQLIQSAFGNYAIQHALQEWGPTTCHNILREIKDNIAVLSTQKFSSNVVEKAIEISTTRDFNDIMERLSDVSVMSQLIESSYGSFVVQKASERATTQQHILDLLVSVSTVSKTIRGKRLRAKWDKVLDAIHLKFKTLNKVNRCTLLRSNTQHFSYDCPISQNYTIEQDALNKQNNNVPILLNTTTPTPSTYGLIHSHCGSSSFISSCGPTQQDYSLTLTTKHCDVPNNNNNNENLGYKGAGSQARTKTSLESFSPVAVSMQASHISSSINKGIFYYNTSSSSNEHHENTLYPQLKALSAFHGDKNTTLNKTNSMPPPSLPFLSSSYTRTPPPPQTTNLCSNALQLPPFFFKPTTATADIRQRSVCSNSNQKTFRSTTWKKPKHTRGRL